MRPQPALALLAYVYGCWSGPDGAATGTDEAPADAPAGDAPEAPGAASLSLGVNERYRDAIELAARRTGTDASAIAAIIDAEAGPVKDAAQRTAMTDEAFRFLHPERDWDERPLNAKDPADKELIEEWKRLYAGKAWDEQSLNAESQAGGLTQFLRSTWRTEAAREGTYLNEVAVQKGLVDENGKILDDAALLKLRFDPTLSIVAAAEYDQSVLDAVMQETKKDPAQADQELSSRHPDRDFAADPLDPKDPADKPLIDEWKEIYESSGTSLVPPGISDDERARYLYLCHHEGETGAIRFLDGSLTDAQAHPLFLANVPDAGKRAALVAEHGSESAAYQAWLWEYIDDHIQPEEFRK